MCASEPASGSLSVRTQPGHRKRSIQSPVPISTTDGWIATRTASPARSSKGAADPWHASPAPALPVLLQVAQVFVERVPNIRGRALEPPRLPGHPETGRCA